MAQQLVDKHGNPLVSEKKTRELADFAAAFAASQGIRGTYDGARTGNDLDNYWANADTFSADSAHSKGVREKLVSRSRYEVANNGYADGIAHTYATDLVGLGPQLRMQTQSKPFNQLVERNWFLWSKASKFRRKLWCMGHAKHVDGESLAVLRTNPRIKSDIKLDFTLYETEQCQTPYVPISDPNYIDGIKFDDFDEPVYYDFLKQHPGASNGIFLSPETQKVPASRVLHWFKMRRPGQHRGVPECASTLNLGAAFRRLREANLATSEKVAAWTLFLKTMFEPETAQQVLPLSTLDIVHGMMTALPNSVEPYQLKAEHPGPTYDTFHRSLLNEQGRPKSMPYNKTACDSSSYNYASGRLDHQTYYGHLDVDREDCNDLVLDPLFETWFDIAIKIFGWLGGKPDSVSAAARFHTWDWPKHRVADVEAEANANRTKLESGQTFPHLLFTDLGLDFDDEIEKAAQAYGVSEDEIKRRLFDVLLPPPKELGKPNPTALQSPAVEAVLQRAFQLPAVVNGNGKHHAN